MCGGEGGLTENEEGRGRATIRQASRYQAFKKADFIVRPTVPHHPSPRKATSGRHGRSEPSGIRAYPADQGRGRLILWELLPGQQDHVAGMGVANLPRTRRAGAIAAVDIIAAQQGNGDATRPLVSAKMGKVMPQRANRKATKGAGWHSDRDRGSGAGDFAW